MSEITTRATTSPVDAAGSGQGNPYVGPRTFTRDQAHLFFGREREAEELFSRVVSQRLVLFYAQSGAGKSSLINTQLIPKLEEAGFVVLPVGRVGGDLLGGVDDAPDNIYLFNLMLSLDQSQRDPTRLAHLTLPHFLDRLTTDDGSHWFYDETDERMTRGQDDTVGEFENEADPEPVEGGAALASTSSAAASSNSPLVSQDEGMTRRDESPSTDTPFTIHHSPFTIHNPSTVLRTSSPPSPNYVLIIDQFEEILTTHGDRWPNRADFFLQLEAAMVAAPALWVVLTLREDFVAGLDPYAPLLSDNLRARYYMQRMGVDSAQLAISQPVARTRPFQPAAVELLVNNLSQVRVAGKASTESGQYIEPVQLQVVCYQLWARLAAGANKPSITVADVQTAGDVDSALATFYEETIAAALRDHPLAGGERRLRRWFEDALITEAGTRGTVYQGESETAGLPNGLVLALADRFLLRSEARAGGRWIELTHDRFVEPIVAANRAWEAKQNNPLTAVTRLWLDNGRDPARLLRGQQLLDAQSYVQTQEHPLSTEEQAFLDACVQAEAEAARQAQLTRLQRLVTVGSLVTLLALIATGWAWQQRYAAVTARTEIEILQQQIQADRMAQIASLTNIDKSLDQYPQRALLLAIEAAQMITPPIPSSLTTLHDLLGRTGGVGLGSHDARVLSVAFAPDGQTLVSGSEDWTIRLWSLADPIADPVVLHGHASGVYSVAFALDGQTLASGGWDGTIRLWSPADPAADPVVLRGHESVVTSVAFAPDGQTLASGSRDGTIRLWSPADPTAAPVVLRGHEDTVYSVAFAPDGQTLASGSWDETIRLRSPADPAADPVVLRGHEGTVTSVAFAPDGQTLVSGDETIRLWSPADPTAAPVVLRGHENFVTSVAFAPDGQTLASGSGDETIRLWSPADPAAAPVVLRGHENFVTSVAFAPDGQTLASGSLDETIRLWSPADPTAAPVVLRGHESVVTSVAFAPDGQTLASGSEDGTIRLWSLADPAADPVVLRGHADTVTSVAFAPDGQTLASGGRDETIRLWSPADPAADPVVLRGHESVVTSVAFAPDGQTLASGGRDGTIRLRSPADPAADPVVLRGHEDTVYSVAFAPDGQTLASGSRDGTIRLWIVQSKKLLVIACKVAGRNLSIDEWQAAFGDRTYRRTCPQWPAGQ